MMVRTSELIGLALDWAVNQIEECCDDPMTPMFSTSWAQGGPIIEREGITIDSFESHHWQRSFATKVLKDEKRVIQGNGPTPLIAAMRCYVAATLGEEVDIPEELVK